MSDRVIQPTMTLGQLATSFLNIYKKSLTAKSGVDARRFLRGLDGIIDDSVVLNYSGQPGLVSRSYGSFKGKEAALKAISRLRREVVTKSFVSQEVVDTAYSVNFGNQDQPLTPISNRLAIIAEQASRGRATGKSFRLDHVIYFTLGENGRISEVTFSYDSYLMSEALSKNKKKVQNPDIDDVLTGKRDTQITAGETLAASLGFFGTFAGIQGVDDLDLLTDVVQPNTAIKFGGDPKILPFADKRVRTGQDGVVMTFTDQLLSSAPRVFDIREIFVKDDRFIANVFEQRTAIRSGINYDIPVNVLFTASRENGGRVASIEGIFDSSITATAFTGVYPFPIPAQSET